MTITPGNEATSSAEEESVYTPYRRPALLLAVAAGLCWASAIALMLSTGLTVPQDIFFPERIIFIILVVVAGLLTFVPIQRHLQLSGLVVEGVAGTSLLLYTLAFVPSPTDWILSLPDTPVYVLFMVALFWSGSAITLPFIYILGQHLFQRRARRYDIRRARRQAHEVGVLLAACAGLASLRVLTLPSVILIILILIVTEMLFLSFVEPDS